MTETAFGGSLTERHDTGRLRMITAGMRLQFLPIDEAIASRAAIVIVTGLDERWMETIMTSLTPSNRLECVGIKLKFCVICSLAGMR